MHKAGFARLCRFSRENATMPVRCVDCLNEAIERCETTGVPLCAEHLWYADDGKRVSERVARQLQSRGENVTAPQVYLADVGAVLALPRLPNGPRPVINTQRNGNDVVALLALISGAISIATGFGIGLALCMPPLPLVPLVLGLIGLAGSKNAVKPDQARIFSWIGVVPGVVFLIIVVVIAGLLLIGGVSSLTPTVYTPAPVPTPTP
jgi:hypothetical protein